MSTLTDIIAAWIAEHNAGGRKHPGGRAWGIAVDLTLIGQSETNPLIHNCAAERRFGNSGKPTGWVIRGVGHVI